MKIEMIQHAIGQGGFFTGSINSDGDRFRYVYDCGSNQIRMLRADIKKAFYDGEHINTLFLSHLDYDHVNGVEDLLKRRSVGTVVLPYIDDVMRQAIIWKNIAHVGIEEPSPYMNFIMDPVASLRGQGAEEVIQLQGEDDDAFETDPEDLDGGDDELETSDALFDPEKSIDPVWVGADRSGRWLGRFRLEDKSSRNMAQFIKVPGPIKYWALIPYVHPPCKTCLKNFSEYMKNNYGDAKNIVSQLGNSKKRNKIKKVYNMLWPDHNLTSMTLYSGPTNSNTLFDLSGNSVFQKTTSGGFLLTGDANFGDNENRARNSTCRRCGAGINGGRRRDKFLSHYRRCSGLVGALMAPHHGSSKNFSMPFVDFFRNLVVCYAAAGTNRYGHPSSYVRRSVHCSSRAFFQTVGNMPCSKLSITL